MDIYATLEEALFSQEPKEKTSLTKIVFDALKSGRHIQHPRNQSPKGHESPSFASFCTIVAPHEVSHKQQLDTVEGFAAFIHAITHIEFCAIDLALDHAYRFANLPDEYHHDWIEVAAEEVEHFEMLLGILQKTGYTYGDFPVHTILFDAMSKTTKLLQRMAVIPRYLEANGLDANPKMASKVRNLPKSALRDETLEALSIILRDEISHVSKGTKWFYHACKLEGIEADRYASVVKEFYPSAFQNRTKAFNTKARLEGGFTDEELYRLSNAL